MHQQRSSTKNPKWTIPTKVCWRPKPTSVSTFDEIQITPRKQRAKRQNSTAPNAPKKNKRTCTMPYPCTETSTPLSRRNNNIGQKTRGCDNDITSLQHQELLDRCKHLEKMNKELLETVGTMFTKMNEVLGATQVYHCVSSPCALQSICVPVSTHTVLQPPCDAHCVLSNSCKSEDEDVDASSDSSSSSSSSSSSMEEDNAYDDDI